MSKPRQIVLALAVLSVLGPSVVRGQSFSPLTVKKSLSDPVFVSWNSFARMSDEGCADCHLVGTSVGALMRGELSRFSRRKEMMNWLETDKHTIARRRVEPLTETQSNGQLKRFAGWLEKARRESLRTMIDANKESGDDTIRLELEDIAAVEFDRDAINQIFGRSNQYSRRICDKLYGEGAVETEKGYARFRAQCLTCHGGYQKSQVADEDATGFSLTDDPSAMQLGIDCFYCHENGNSDDWVGDHQKKKGPWRLLKPADKSAKGMRDLAHTSTQAQLCFDCHIGNRDKGMFVTHEMYAAGHPPLPSIELETFTAEMPRHWQTPGELYANTKGTDDETDCKAFLEINYEDLDPESTKWETRKLLIGAIESKRHQLKLLIDSSEVDGGWADYALYDCSACHHELRSDSARQARSLTTKSAFQGAPGRPRQHEWASTLSNVAAEVAGEPELNKTLGRLRNELDQCFAGRPFGDPATVRTKASDLRKQLGRLTHAVETKRIDESTTRKVLGSLATLPTESLLTYDAARQVAWAAKVLSKDLGAKPDEIIKRFQADGMIDPSLPSTRDRFIYPDFMKMHYRKRSEYNPTKFGKQLSTIPSP